MLIDSNTQYLLYIMMSELTVIENLLYTAGNIHIAVLLKKALALAPF